VSTVVSDEVNSLFVIDGSSVMSVDSDVGVDVADVVAVEHKT